MYRRVAAAVVTSLVIGVLATVMMLSKASAEPGVVTKFPASASSTRFKGQAFDVCTAPSISQMSSWSTSPYGAIAVYVGGPNRGCAQPNLTPAWVKAINIQGWKLVPLYVGLQAPCAVRTTFKTIDADQAAVQGTESATDAITKLKALGLRPGSIVYADMESYRSGEPDCRETVLTYISAYIKELHRRGYLAGVYGKAASTIGDLNEAHDSTTYARPDAIWLAEWDGVKKLTEFPSVPATSWSTHQRIKQYLGDHYETYGTVKLRIDSNAIDAPVATVTSTYKTIRRTNLRAAPSRLADAAGIIEKNISLNVVCQTPGRAVAGTKVWNKLSNGTYISDYYVNTASSTGYTSTIARCQYPYQVTPSSGTITRTGAGATFAQNGSLPSGALAWTICQSTANEKTGTSNVWSRLPYGLYVSDYDLASASQTTYSPNIPRC